MTAKTASFLDRIKVFVQSHPLALILLLATVVRLWGIWHGYPYSYYPDEQHFINRSVSFGSGDFNPHWFHKPAFLMYLLFGLYGIYFCVGWVFGAFAGIQDFAVAYFHNVWPFVLLGRLLVTSFGIATVYVVYKIGERFFSRHMGLFGALFLTLSYGHIFSGQDVKADVPSTFFTVLAVYYLLKIVTEDFKTRDYALAAAMAGLGTATKYYSIILLPLLFLVCAWELFHTRSFRAVGKYGVAFIAYWTTYFFASPFNFIDPLGRRGTFGSLLGLMHKILPFVPNPYAPLPGAETAHFLAENRLGHWFLRSIENYVSVQFSTEGMGFLLAALAAVSLVSFLTRPNTKKLFLVAFPVVFSLVSVYTAPSYTEPRHQLIIYPFLCLVAATFVAGNNPYGWARSARVAMLILLLIPLFHVLQQNIFVSRTDTRTLAKRWIEKNIAPGTKILLDEYSPFLQDSPVNLQSMLDSARQTQDGQFTTHLADYYRYRQLAATEPSYDIREIRHTWWRSSEVSDGEHGLTSEFDRDMANPTKPVGVTDYNEYQRRGFEYAITSKTAYGAYMKEGSRKQKNFPSFFRFYTELFARGEEVMTFAPEELRSPGPLVHVFRLR